MVDVNFDASTMVHQSITIATKITIEHDQGVDCPPIVFAGSLVSYFIILIFAASFTKTSFSI